ncbi:hypothetical protein SUNI508_12254 [Seiridium unicorne]|uniref:Uncharacterized protein n=1 Tax=Seiridium unicorne TaxID=138068 RepID=A0ABR2UEY5_9PEZI
MADLDGGLFSISLSDGDDSAPEAAEPSKSAAIKTPGTARVAQSEDSFQTVKQGYRVKIENGELWKEIKLPLCGRVAKQDAQALLHAVEELYFLKRYDEGAAFVTEVLGNEDSGCDGLDADTSKTLKYYQSKCDQRSPERVK